MSAPFASAPIPPRPPIPKKTAPRVLFPVLVGVAALLIGGGIGAASTYLTMDPQIEALTQDLDDTRQELDDTSAELASVNNGLAERERQLDKRASALGEDEQAVSDREEDVAKREEAVTGEEERIAANTFGSGVHLIGKDIDPGTYRTGNANSESCYYAWLTGTGSDADIIDNNIIDGPGTVTLNDGDIFEVSRCTWTKSD